MFKKVIVIIVSIMFIFIDTDVSAQEVMMNSAETIKPGNFKLGIFPTVLFGKNGEKSVFGVAGRFGFALSPRVDIEAKASIFKNLTYFGADLEYWLVKGRNLNASVAVGGHITKQDNAPDSSGIDAAFMVSTSPVNNLEIYGGLKIAFDSFKNSDQNYTLAYLVPGIEYRISDDLDFLAELGIALKENARSYGSVGFAYYFQL